MDLSNYTNDMEEIDCNICKSEEFEKLHDEDRFDLKIDTVICRNCGLMYLNPRPTKEKYEKFYESDYRVAVSGSDKGSDKQFKKQETFTKQTVIPFVKKIIQKNELHNYTSILDIGCSYGGILHEFKKELPNLSGEGIEPVIKISQFASKKTNSVIHTDILENFNTSKKYDIIVFSKALNHSLDPKGNLEKINNLLSNEGIFVIVLYDALNALKYKPFSKMAEMTHPYMFSPETITYLLEETNFTITAIKSPPKNNIMKKISIKKNKYEPILIIAKKSKYKNTPQKPDVSKIMSEIKFNKKFYNKYKKEIKRWNENTIPKRIVRRIYGIITK